MAKIEDVMRLFRNVEFSNDNSKLLHKNPTETGLTFYGIYETAHPKWEGWNIIKRYLKIEPDLKKCSVVLSNNIELDLMVQNFYKKEFWNKARLDEVTSQKIADEIFIFGVNAGMKVAITKAQLLVGASQDGILGSKTIALLNKYDEAKFDVLFDEEEIKHYDKLIKLHSKFEINKKGWHNRAKAV